ncbi:uncharacterized protein LOC124414493 [Diprion similis]|uniref:uncharacterized protein LOC124414493 n=1 Tax=Diprion similis TaxID=362088 RepID=UPI001EF7FBBA|nr:uncharacterized protein LOC124414493 [Diprion similis]
MAALLVSLPMQLACQIMCAANSTNENVNFVQNTLISKQNSFSLPEGYISFPDIGLAYKSHHTKAVTWDEARSRCIQDDATMAVIDSWKTLEYIMKVKPITSDPYLGIHRFFNKEEWTSVKNGLPVPFVPWGPDQPARNADLNCGAMWADGRGLAAASCDGYKRHFLCEISVPRLTTISSDKTA